MKTFVLALVAFIGSLSAFLAWNGVQRPPNFIVIFADDMGYGDLQCYGHPTQERGPLETMAEEGMRFTRWYSADSLCTPSRAALLTGRLPIRSGMVGPNRVVWQWDAGGLPKSELTIAERLLEVGYKTGMVGKWHLGINEEVVNDGRHLPFYHGFEYVGTNYPYGQNWKCDPDKFTTEEMSVKCFKYRNTTMVQQPTTLKNSTQELVEDTKNFLKGNVGNPFFFYMPLLQTHSSLFCDPNFCGKSKRGMYGDNVNEMAWAVGEVLSSLREYGIDRNTLVIFLSDHGPQRELCTEGGSTGGLKGGKGSTWDGGLLVPAIAWWPGVIPAGTVSRTVVSTLDIYPTLLNLAGVRDVEETGGVHDGENILPIFTNEANTSPHEFLFHYCSDRLMAVRYNDLKIHYFTQKLRINYTELCTNGEANDDVLTFLDCYGDNVEEHRPPLIFNVGTDPAENYPLDAADYGEILEKTELEIERHRATIVGVPSQLGLKNEALQPCCDPPVCTCNYLRDSANAKRTEL